LYFLTGVAPFYLYPCIDKLWMCPVCLFVEWWKLSDGSKGRYVFRKKSGSRFSVDPLDFMASDCYPSSVAILGSRSHFQHSESFLECFQKNLCDIGIDPCPYGTNSFCHGGCQYLAMVLCWPFRNICTWGGWVENFNNPGTIFKYLLSWTDTPLLEHEDYFNPNSGGSNLCTAYGHSCWCVETFIFHIEAIQMHSTYCK